MFNERIRKNLSPAFVGDMIGKTGEYIGKLERGEITINEKHQMILIKYLWGSYIDYQGDFSALYIAQGRNKN